MHAHKELNMETRDMKKEFADVDITKKHNS
jgi:hypothetical protein